MVVNTLIGVLVLTLGWAVLYGAVNQYRTKMMIEETPTQPVRSIALGRVEVKGEAEPVETPLESPFSGTECVLYRRGRPSASGLDPEAVHVFGQAVPREGVSSPDNPANILIRHDDRLPTFRVSPKSEVDLVESLESKVKWGLAVGAGVAGFGFLRVLLVAGPIVGVAITPLSLGVGVLFNKVVDLSKVRVSDRE